MYRFALRVKLKLLPPMRCLILRVPSREKDKERQVDTSMLISLSIQSAMVVKQTLTNEVDTMNNIIILASKRSQLSQAHVVKLVIQYVEFIMRCLSYSSAPGGDNSSQTALSYTHINFNSKLPMDSRETLETACLRQLFNKIDKHTLYTT